MKNPQEIRCAVIGYGGAYSMGKNHVGWINETPGLTAVAVCDVDASRLAIAKEEWPGIKTYRGAGVLLTRADFDLAVILRQGRVLLVAAGRGQAPADQDGQYCAKPEMNSPLHFSPPGCVLWTSNYSC